MDVAEKPQAPSAPRWSDEQIRTMVANARREGAKIGRRKGAPLSLTFWECTCIVLCWHSFGGFLAATLGPVLGDHLGAALWAMVIAAIPVALVVRSRRTASNRRMTERLLREGRARPTRAASFGEHLYRLSWDSSRPHLDAFEVWCQPEEKALVESASVLTLGSNRLPCCAVVGDQVTLRRGWL